MSEPFFMNKGLKVQMGIDRGEVWQPRECSPMRFGPPAREKIMSMAAAQADASSSWPSGKAVKIAFTDMDGAKATKNLMWNPEKEKIGRAHV